jgi:hypothetical protein
LVYLIQGFAGVSGYVFEDADRCVELAAKGGERLVAAYLNLDERPQEIADILAVLAFVVMLHWIRFLPLEVLRTPCDDACGCAAC